ncbi:transporter [Tenacibaculum sp. FZY0031]|uniref:transporter n=1 Tax=Tenacibaculum sp. FZY0031 TaxID=3116648 RepID=UPI002EBC673E|nr:transporter [Tenacibaculum sp. FZY0031]
MKNLSETKDLLNKGMFILGILISVQIQANTPFPERYELFLDCDACGCSNSGGSLGMGGIIDNNFVGVRYLHQKYQSKDGIFKNSPIINEYFNTVQVWSRIPIINEYLEAQVFVPFHFHTRDYIDKTTAIEGLGDISFLINYTFLNKTTGKYKEEKDKIISSNHLLKIGAGMKLPTGTYNEAINNSINPSFQLGTGSIDIITNLQYVYKRNDFGITNYFNYYIKTTNKEEYRFGNQFNFNSTFFYMFKDSKQNSFVPSVGISGEVFASNKTIGLKVKDTEGYALFSNLGAEYNAKKLTIGVLAMYPIQQNLAQGTIEVKYRSAIYLNYNF